jgi:hypothetical protein
MNDKSNSKITLGNIIGSNDLETFEDFDLTEVQKVLYQLSNDNAIDIAHSEMLQQKALYGAEILTGYIGKLVKTVGFLESKLNAVKNKVSLEYRAPDGKTTADMKKQAGESSPEVEELGMKLAKAKGSKTLLERKYEILLKQHHHYKDMAMSQRKGMMSATSSTSRTIGWE